MPPIFVLVRVQLAEIVAKHVGQIAFPAVAALVSMQPVAQGLIGDALEVGVQRGIHAQAAFVDRRRPVRCFEVFSNLFKKIRREVIARILHVQAECRLGGGGFFSRRDFSFFFHAVQHQVAPRQRAFGVEQRGIFRPVDHSREQRRFRKRQIAD